MKSIRFAIFISSITFTSFLHAQTPTSQPGSQTQTGSTTTTTTTSTIFTGAEQAASPQRDATPDNQSGPTIVDEGGNLRVVPNLTAPGSVNIEGQMTGSPADQRNTTNVTTIPPTQPPAPPGASYAPTGEAPVTAYPTPETVPPASQTLPPPTANVQTPSVPTSPDVITPQSTQPIQTVESASETNQTPQQPSFAKPGQQVLPSFNQAKEAAQPPFNQTPVQTAPISPTNPPSTEGTQFRNTNQQNSLKENDPEYVNAFPELQNDATNNA